MCHQATMQATGIIMLYTDIIMSHYDNYLLNYNLIIYVQYLDHNTPYRDILKLHNQAKIVFSLLYMSLICEH